MSKVFEENGVKLFQIGDAAKLMGVTRKMILNYEAWGLLIPAKKDEFSGYRYYSADNLTQIRLIRALQDLGLSLLEIHSYLDDTLQLEPTIARLRDLRDRLDSSIAKLQVRAEKNQPPEIRWTVLPQQTVYCRKSEGKSVSEHANNLRDAYLEALEKYGIKHSAEMFMEFPLEENGSCLMCIPVRDGCVGENIRVLPKAYAVSVYHRGPYEQIPQVRQRILEFIRKKGMKPCGVSRNVYMEGPPNRGKDKEKYITQVSVLVEDDFYGLWRG